MDANIAADGSAVGGTADRRAGRASTRACAAARRPAHVAALHGAARDAQLQIRPSAGADAASQALARGQAEAGRDRVRGTRRGASGRQGRTDRAGTLDVDRARDEDPLPRGRRLDRREDRDGPGVHDLGLPARGDRARVRDRRPRDVHRLRPRRRRGGAPDPAPGDRQARRERGQQRLDRLRSVHPARGDGGRQRDHRDQRGRDQGRAAERGRGWAAGEGHPDAADAEADALGVMELHAAENRGYRELYVYTREIVDHWPKLAERMGGSSAERALNDGAAAAQELLSELEQRTREYGLYGKPAAEGLGANLARTRRGVRDRFLERNQALRFAVSDAQHVVTLLGFLEQVARSRGDDALRAFCSDQRSRLMPVERTARAAAIELGSSPHEAIEALHDSAVGRVAHGAAYAFGSFGEWVDRRAGGK